MISSLPRLLFLILWSIALPLDAVKIRVATFNILDGIDEAGEPGRDELENILARIDADIVGLQEVFNSDFNGGDTNLDSLSSNLGYPHVFVSTEALDTQRRVVLLSKFPFIPSSLTSIDSPPGANDVTRTTPAAIVDVPGTANDPIIIAAHLKCCFEMDDPFRRAVEMIRIRKHLESLGLDGDDNIFIMGDFNLLGGDLTFNAEPAGLPASYQLGNDITFPVSYFSDPTQYFTGQGLTNPGYRHQNGISTATFMGSGSILDHLLISDAIASRMPMTEIYNSELDNSFPGLPKSGMPLPFNTSDGASDHYPVYGDFELDGGLDLSVAVSPAIFDEDSPAATVTVSLPEARAITTTITLQSGDPGEAALADSTVTILAGATSGTTTLLPKLDRIADGNQSFDLIASAAGFQGSTAGVTVRDADPQTYSFTNPTTPILETFANFDGSQSLAAWNDGGAAWLGLDDGSRTVLGARSFQSAPGVLTAGSTSFSTVVRNDSGSSIDALSISYLAQQWRRFQNGSQDRWEVFVTRNGVEIFLKELTFVASATGPSGVLSPPLALQKQAYLRGLDLAPSEEISLDFRAIPGAIGGNGSNDVFINEFHYDNTGGDEGEFVEIVVGSGYLGNLGEISLYLYNGSGGSTYGNVHPLTTFQINPDTPPGSPRFYSKRISGIQNGPKDGFALVVDGEVREFISYEGSFSATNGPANGLASTQVGVSQTSSTPVGRNSVARTGTGGTAEDFTWQIQSGPHTPGTLNQGQAFGASPQPQGISFDDLILTPLRDSDGDLLPDLEEEALGTNPNMADSDSDGQSDFFEAILAGSDPLSITSTFQIDLTSSNDVTTITFPSQIDRNYRVERSSNILEWLSSPVMAGTGAPLSRDFTSTERLFFRIRIDNR
jgi:endonuclease/exonuclease/phosphatase family metal-dependent hydrolase